MHQVESCLKKVAVSEKDPLKGLQSCLWIVLPAYRKQHERADQKARENERMKEMSEALGHASLKKYILDNQLCQHQYT